MENCTFSEYPAVLVKLKLLANIEFGGGSEPIRLFSFSAFQLKNQPPSRPSLVPT
jgi:hypothetical protein